MTTLKRRRPALVIDSSDEERNDYDSASHSKVSRRNVVLISSDEEEETPQTHVCSRKAVSNKEREQEDDEKEINDGVPFTLDRIIANVEAHPDVQGAWVTNWIGQTHYIISSVCRERDNNYKRNLVPLVVKLTNENTEMKNSRLCVKNMIADPNHLYTTAGIPHPKSGIKWVYKCCCHMEDLSELHGVRHKSSGVVFLVGCVCLENFGQTKDEVQSFLRWAKKQTGGHRILPLELRGFATLKRCPVPKPKFVF
jgi:hypothetical protein